MRPERFPAERLENLLHERKMATLPELKRALGTNVDGTVFRKLKQLSYHTSYSHRGRYYTLDGIARFNELGLWSCDSVRFSRFGTLLSTAEEFVEEAGAGCFAHELENILQVGVKDALLKLVREKRLARERIGKAFLYCSVDPFVRKEQLLYRHALESEPSLGAVPAGVLPDELKAAIVLFFCRLDEKQRRLYAGLESLKFGYGGDRKIADLLGLDVATVAKGRRQILQGDFELQRVRRPGGGRKRVEKKRRGS